QYGPADAAEFVTEAGDDIRGIAWYRHAMAILSLSDLSDANPNVRGFDPTPEEPRSTSSLSASSAAESASASSILSIRRCTNCSHALELAGFVTPVPSFATFSGLDNALSEDAATASTLPDAMACAAK
ncbi:hypothetical protein HDU80_011800, partial [Chytriomyces hyalinus]